MQNDGLTYVGNGHRPFLRPNGSVILSDRRESKDLRTLVLHSRHPYGTDSRLGAGSWGFFGRQRECGTARFFECHCSAAVSAYCRLSPDSFFPPPQGGRQIVVNILHPAFCILHFLRPQLPPAFTVCWHLRRIRRVYVRAAGGGCGRTCAQGGARTIYSCMGWCLLSFFQGCRPFEPPPIILGSISKAPPWPGQRAGSPAAPVALL